MNALKGLTSVHTTVRTPLEATHVAVGQDIGWPLMDALAMVSECKGARSLSLSRLFIISCVVHLLSSPIYFLFYRIIFQILMNVLKE